jgi:calcineurin-like phosphoesterase family protein
MKLNPIRIPIVSLLILAGFYSLPCRGEAWRFIVTADSRSDSHSDNNGVNVKILTEVATEILARDVEFVLFAGDLSNGGVSQELMEVEFLTWRDTMQPVYDAGIGVYPVRGNHDVGSPAGTTAWNNVFRDESANGGTNYLMPQNGPDGEKNLTYSVTHRNVFAMGFDQLATPNHDKNYVHQGWMDDQLAANTKTHIFAFGHFTAFKMIWDSLGDHPAARDLFWNALENSGGRTYFCGHEHFYNHARADDDGDPNNDLHQYVVGSAGASIHIWNGTYPGDNGGRIITPIYHTTRFGYILVEIDDCQVKLTWMERDTDDETVDGIYLPNDTWEYTIGCGNPAYSPPTGDINSDCVVNLDDWAIVAGQWHQTNCLIPNGCDGADLTQDGNVDLLDYAVLVTHWLEDTRPVCE